MISSACHLSIIAVRGTVVFPLAPSFGATGNIPQPWADIQCFFNVSAPRFPLAQEPHPVPQASPIPAPAEKAMAGIGAVLTCRKGGPRRLCTPLQTQSLWDKKSGAALFGAAAVTSLVHLSVPPSAAPARSAGPGLCIRSLSGPAGALSAGRCPAPGLPPENSLVPGRAPLALPE